MITLTDEKTCKDIQVKISEIQAVKEGSVMENGRSYPYTDVFFGESEPGKCVRVVESANEIGRKIISELKKSGEDIKMVEPEETKKRRAKK